MASQRPITSLHPQRKPTFRKIVLKPIVLSDDEKDFLTHTFLNYEDCLKEWVDQESIKYKPKKNHTFPMLTLPELKDKKIEKIQDVYTQWQTIVNRCVIRST